MPRVSIKDTNTVITATKGEILYDALYDRGINLPHGCLSGSCGACRVEVETHLCGLKEPGAIEKNTIEALEKEFPGKKIRLSCRAVIEEDVLISIIK